VVDDEVGLDEGQNLDDEIGLDEGQGLV